MTDLDQRSPPVRRPVKIGGFQTGWIHEKPDGKRKGEGEGTH
jgi:hypothetical protein